LVKLIVKKFKLSTKEAEALAEFLLSKAFEEAAEKLIEEMIDYDGEEVWERDVDEMYEKVSKSMFEGKGPVIITFGQGNMFYADLQKKTFNEIMNHSYSKFYKHIAISPVGRDVSLKHVMFDNDYIQTLPEIIQSHNYTHINPVRNIYYIKEIKLPEEFSNGYHIIDEDFGEYNDYDEGFWLRYGFKQ
jgi:hypothetical protein